MLFKYWKKFRITSCLPWRGVYILPRIWIFKIFFKIVLSGRLFSSTLQIPDSHYEKKNLKTGKNLLVLSKTLLVTRIWDLLRFSMSQKVFSTSKFWLILSKNFLDSGMEFVYTKMTTYKIVSPRKSIFPMRIFFTLKRSYNKHYIHFLKKHQINSVQFQICLGNFKNEPQKWTYT